MSTLLIKRAYRVLMLSMASILIASMLAPIVAVASTDLVAGDSVIPKVLIFEPTQRFWMTPPFPQSFHKVPQFGFRKTRSTTTRAFGFM